MSYGPDLRGVWIMVGLAIVGALAVLGGVISLVWWLVLHLVWAA